MSKEIEKAEEIFTLMILGKMNVTEINSLTDLERFYLSKWFKERYENEKKFYKEVPQSLKTKQRWVM